MESKIERLRLLNLPVFRDVEELASLIHLDHRRLYTLVKSSNRFYYRYSIKKPSGGDRKIRQPSKEMKAIQAWILRNILDKLTPSDHATAFIQGRSILSNVLPHANNRYFVCMDIEEFFPSITFHSVKRIFKMIGYFSYAPGILADLCTCDIGLPQGGITSPSLSNLAAARLDRRLSGFTSRRNIIYTRYADDMTFSSNNRDVLNKSISILMEIIRSERFTPHPSKLRVMGPRIRCSITGLVKNSSEPKFGVGKKKKRIMRAVMHNLLTRKSVDPVYSNEESIRGWLSYLKSIDVKSYESMTAYWQNIKAKY
jgi:RNA-directed DNA polymerase